MLLSASVDLFRSSRCSQASVRRPASEDLSGAASGWGTPGDNAQLELPPCIARAGKADIDPIPDIGIARKR
jgi:hypothetical protein